jgi:hypothetical protein
MVVAMKSLATHLSVVAACLAAGALAGTALTASAGHTPAALRSAVQPPEQVRTETVTRVIHRVRRVHVHPKPNPAPRVIAAPPAPAPSRVTLASAPVAVTPRRVQVAPAPVPPAHSAPAGGGKPTLHTGSSGHSGTRSKGGDDGGERDD